MQIVDNIIILFLLTIAFFTGKKISDNYHSSTIEELQYMLRISETKQGVGYIAPPTRKRMPIGQPFMDKLKANGRATQRFTPSQTP